MEQLKASLDSQLGTALCEAEDTEEMFWLRESDDYQSKVALGNALSAQYRFREAAEAYLSAARVRNDDPMLFIRLGGAYLSVFEFQAAYDAYKNALRFGASEKAVAYPLGIWHYLQGKYHDAAAWLEKCLPCGDEMAIAVIYWHCLCRLREQRDLDMLSELRQDMKVGHHTAYRDAVSLFAGEIAADTMMRELTREQDDLNYVIAAYGVSRYLLTCGDRARGTELLKKICSREKVWACISYLAAWNDLNGEYTGEVG